jgi:alkylhydroperoxidase family enzyme
MADDVQIANRRLDASGNEALIGMARMGADAFGYTAELRIDRGLAELHSDADQAALRYTEALTRAADTDRDAAFQRFHDAVAEHFSQEEMLEIVAVVVNMNVWTRIKLAEGAMPGPAD